MHHRVYRTYACPCGGEPLAHSFSIRETDSGDARRDIVLTHYLRHVMPSYIARGDERDGIRQFGFCDAAGDDLLGILTSRQISITDFDPCDLPSNLKSRPCERPTQHVLRLVEVCEQETLSVREGKWKA